MSNAAKTQQTGGHEASREWFSHFARVTALWSGKPVVFSLALLTILVWGLTGPMFDFSDTWQLVINTGTTIVTFLMVFLIQNTQNRDTMAIQLKLSELVLTMRGAENRIAMAEEMTDAELEALHQACRLRADQALQSLTERRKAKLEAGKGKAAAE